MKPSIGLLLAFLIAIGCQPDKAQPENNKQQSEYLPNSSGASNTANKPDTQITTEQTEGVAPTNSVTLFKSPDGWPIKFTTKLPSSILAQAASSGEGEAIHFSYKQAVLIFYLFPAGTSQSSAQKFAAQVLSSQSYQSCTNSQPWEWGCLYTNDASAIQSRIRLGKQKNRLFYFFYRYPTKLTEEFLPQADQVLANWSWQ